MKRVFLGGEGRNDLGGWCGLPEHRQPEIDGVIVALLAKKAPTGWHVRDACEWRRVAKYRSGGRMGAEMRATLGVVLMAKERGCDVVVFVRDADRDPHRAREIDDAIAGARATIADAPFIVGGVAVRRLESWVLALHGERGTEAMSNAKVDEGLASRGVAAKDSQALVAAVKRADLGAVPTDAGSLKRWLELVDRAFGDTAGAGGADDVQPV